MLSRSVCRAVCYLNCCLVMCQQEGPSLQAGFLVVADVTLLAFVLLHHAKEKAKCIVDRRGSLSGVHTSRESGWSGECEFLT